MIYYITIDQLLSSKRERVEKDLNSIYDLTVKDVLRSERQYLYNYKWLGHSVVFRYHGRHKILIYNK